jgi:uncharacterized membrane protein YcgQ (UPF0703/DUF1980 family)
VALEKVEAEQMVNARAVFTDVGQLELAANNPEQRDYFRGQKRVAVEGLFSPVGFNDQSQATFFNLVRLRMACCINDARPAVMMAVTRGLRVGEKDRDGRPVVFITGPNKADVVRANDWVTAEGRVDFFPSRDGTVRPVMRVLKVTKTKLPADPYLK